MPAAPQGPRRPPMITPPAGLPAQGPQRPSGSVPHTGTPSAGVPVGRRSGSVPASATPPGGVNASRSSGSAPAAPQASVAGTMEAIQLLMALRGAASKVKQVHMVDQISHGLQSLGIKMPDSKGALPNMVTPTAAVPATAFIELLVRVHSEAKKAKQFSLAERVRSGLESLGYHVEEGPDHSSIARRIKQ